MGPESALWNWLRKGLKPLGRPHDVHRIETSTERGYPDVEGCIGGQCFLLELKVAHYTRRDGTFSLPHYTSKQAYTLHKRVAAGGDAWILIREEKAHYLVHGRHALDLYEARYDLSEPNLLGMREPIDARASAQLLWEAMVPKKTVG